VGVTAQRQTRSDPFFSVCIPQFDRTDHLLFALDTLRHQSSRDFEICISDDASPEGRHQEIILFLEDSGLDFVYRVNPTNLRYDGNLRSAISLARGRYCFLHGNDDCLSSKDTLLHLRTRLETSNYPAVVITNFEDFTTGKVHRRIRDESLVAGGPGVAAGNFRNFSFVTGIILDRSKCGALANTRWDGSEMYQMYLGTCLIAGQAGLLRTPYVSARKDIVIAHQSVDSFLTSSTTAQPGDWSPIVRPVHQLARLVVDAIREGTKTRPPFGIPLRVCLQLYCFTLPFWLVECRSHKGWIYAFRFNLASRPSQLARGIGLGPVGAATSWVCYVMTSVAGLTAPIGFSRRLFPLLYRLRNVIR
jgi:hypothetical protein